MEDTMIDRDVSIVELKRRIAEERAGLQSLTVDEIYHLIENGRGDRAIGTILFHTQANELSEKLESLLSVVREKYAQVEEGLQANFLEFLASLSISFNSYLPNWVLAKELDSSAMMEAGKKVLGLLEELEASNEKAASKAMLSIRRNCSARLTTEGLNEGEATEETNRLMGESLVDYALNIAKELKNSNLLRVAQSDSYTQLGNDYALYLDYMLYLGASFSTTNPVLIKMAWDSNPELWDRRIETLILSKYGQADLTSLLKGPEESLNEAISAISSMISMAIVKENCLLLRDIFLVTEGRQGYVSLQVNPKNNNDVGRMVVEAEKLYLEMERQLSGVPNVVFKLPATAAGKYAAEKLTSQGIGVTITVAFSVSQTLVFAEALMESRALVSYLTLMNGRMATPVLDEMKSNGVEKGEEAARWAGVEVARKAYKKIYKTPSEGGLALDSERVKLLIASLRIYDGWIPDISELWGCPIITIFPNVRREFDAQHRDFVDNTIRNATPAEDMSVLFKSEIFRQAWWTSGDSQEYRPACPLSLDMNDNEELSNWTPIKNTLTQFIEFYDSMGQMIKKRIEKIVSDR